MPSLIKTTEVEEEVTPITEQSKKVKTRPKIFQPFRRIGHITSNVPFSIQARGQAFFITTCVENTFHIYDVSTLLPYLLLPPP